MLGFNTDKVAQGEIDSGGLNRRGKMEEWDLGDDFRAGFYGLFGKDYSRATLEEKARDKQTLNYNDNENISGLNTALTQYRPGTVITRKAGETLADMQARGRNELGLGKSISAAKITNPKANFSGVKTVQDLATVIAQDNEKQEYEVGGPKYIEQQRLEDKKEAERRYYADRQDARRSENRLYQMQMMQLQQADKQKSQDRRDRMIMTLMAGLQNLGQGFTI